MIEPGGRSGSISNDSINPRSAIGVRNLPSADGKYSLYCAVIVKRVDAKTRGQVGINALRVIVDD